MDAAHEWTDREIDRLTKSFRKIYRDAAKEMRQKVNHALREYDEKNKSWRERLKSGEVDKKTYDAWLKSQSLKQAYFKDLAEHLANDAVVADQLALDTINATIPHVFAENANMAAYSVDKHFNADHSFDLYDVDTVRRLQRDDPELLPPLPEPSLDKGRDYTWNRQKFSSAITQSILQGESVKDAAARITRVLGMDESAATRAARTALTGAENAGRTESYRRAKNMGIELEQQWLATLDNRTRHSHRLLDGQHVPIGEKFKVDGQELEFPGDPTAPAEYVYNCRCTLIAWFPDIEKEDPARASKLPDDITYEEWKYQRRCISNSERILEVPYNREKTALDILDYNHDTGIQPLHRLANTEPITEENFFTSTVATFTPTEKPKRPPDYISGSGSQYWYTEDGVTRYSDHWGSDVATCSWFLEGENELRAYTTFSDGGLASTFGTNQMRYSGLAFKDSYAYCSWDDFTRKSDVIGGVDDDEYLRLRGRGKRIADSLIKASQDTTDIISERNTLEAFSREHNTEIRYSVSKKGNEVASIILPDGSELVVPRNEVVKQRNIRYTVTHEADASSYLEELSDEDRRLLDVMLENDHLDKKSSEQVRLIVDLAYIKGN